MPSVADRLSYLCPPEPIRLARAKAAGFGRIQLRLGPEFSLPVDRFDADAVARLRDDLEQRGLAVESIGFYRNHLHPDPAVRQADADRLRVVYRIAEFFGVTTIGVFAGRDPEKTVEENLPGFVATWRPLVEEAEARGLALAFENCSMYRGYPVRGINMTHCPAAYDLIFAALPSPAVAMEFDPSHCLKQRIDPIAMVRRFGDRIRHVHLKDHEILADDLQQWGSFEPRTSRDRLPGRGETDFAALLAVLAEVGYTGALAFEGDADPDAASEQQFTTLLDASRRWVAHGAPK